MPRSRLTFLRVTKAYGTHAVLKGVSLSVTGGAIHAVEGTKGSGKTTLVEIAAGFLPTDRGLIVLESGPTLSVTLNYRAPNTRVADGIAYVPQVRRALGGLSTLDNLKIARGPSRSENSDADAAIFSCLDELRLTRLLDRHPVNMNRSDQLFLALAQAYLQKPLFLMIDEPFPGLSSHDLQQCITILRRLRNAGTGILVTDHNPQAILEIADTVSILSEGVIAYSGTARAAVNA